MNDLPNEICVNILMFLSYYGFLVLSKVSKRLYFLCNQRVEFKKLVNDVWNLYSEKRLYVNAVEVCQFGILKDLKKSFSGKFKSKQYLVSCLEKILISSFEDLNPVSAFFILFLVIEK